MTQDSQAAQPIAETLFSVNLSEEQLQRFWEKVTKGSPDECWNWNASKDDLSYGTVFLEKKCRRAHRVVFFLSKGPFPNVLKVCHTCDNPSCCNPKHLWLGTDADNVRDRDAKGRLINGKKYYGSSHVKSKLTEREVLQIRALSKFGWWQRELAEMYGVSQVTIHRIVRGTRWKHIPICP